MKAVPHLLSLALWLTASSGYAQTSSAPASEAAPRLQVHSQLPAGLERHGVAAHFAEDKAHFWGCVGSCGLGREQELIVEIPKEARGKKRSVKRMGTKDHPVLWVRWGSTQEFYSMLVIGASSAEEGAGQPRLVLKGWAGDESKSAMTLVEDGPGGLTLASAPKEAFCGHLLPRRTRVLRPAEGRFASVRAPALSASERESASTISARAVDELESTLIGLASGQPGSSRVPVDGDRAAPWQGGYEWVELAIPEGAQFPLAVEFAEPLQEPTALYLVLGQRVHQVEFTPHDSRLYLVEAPVPDEDLSCVALVQPHTPAPVTEVMATSLSSSLRAMGELVDALDKSEPGLAPAALRVRGKAAGEALGSRFSKLSALGQARAFEVAEALPQDAGLPVFVAAIEAGSAQSEEALEAVARMERQGSEALLEKLQGASESAAARLIVALTNLDPLLVAEEFPRLLDDAAAERRGKLRAALGHVAKTKQGRLAVGRWLGESPSSLSRRARFELVRALAAQLEQVDGGVASLAALSESADFHEAYLLAPLVVAHFRKAPEFRNALSRWLAGKAAGAPSPQQEAALSVRVLDTILEGGDRKIPKALGPALRAALEDDNMRVRRAALFNVARFESGVSLTVDEVVDLLSDDDWPEVRAAAALAVVPVADGKLEGRAERVVLRHLRKDPDATVRRAVARTLAEASGQEVVDAVRRAFERDENFSVRAEAAVTLGKLCDEGSIDALTTRARSLGTGLTDEGAIELGLSSVTALAYLVPDDINKRLAPVLSGKAPRVTRAQVKRRIEAVRASEDRAICAR